MEVVNITALIQKVASIVPVLMDTNSQMMFIVQVCREYYLNNCTIIIFVTLDIFHFSSTDNRAEKVIRFLLSFMILNYF